MRVSCVNVLGVDLLDAVVGDVETDRPGELWVNCILPELEVDDGGGTLPIFAQDHSGLGVPHSTEDYELGAVHAESPDAKSS